MKRFLLLIFLSSVICSPALAQAPNISYSSPQTYFAGTAISPLNPNNGGGGVPSNLYLQVSTFTGGSGVFNNIVGIAADPSGNVYVADAGNNVIDKITPAGVVSLFAGSGAAAYADGTGSAASFNMPYGLVTDKQGNVYVGDSGNNLIRKITPAGVVTTFAGSGIYGLTNGAALTATFKTPAGLAFDTQGNLYVADYGNNVIRKISTAGAVTTLAGTGATGAKNGAGANATFNAPIAIACDKSGNIYVADKGNNLIRKVTSTGTVTTLAGSGVAGSADGTGTAASFSTPYGVAVDALGNVYVADADFCLIRQITTAGVVTTLAGDGNYALTNGIGTAAEFSYPTGIGIDSNGNLFISDNGNQAVREMRTTGYSIAPALPAGLTFAATGIISGTPTAASPQTVYTVSAYNTSGSSTSQLTITVISYVSDAALKGLSISTGTLNPSFSSTALNYGVSIPNSTNSITVTPTADGPSATIKINGTPVSSESPSAPIALSTGGNTINVTVTAQDGVTVQNYTIVVTRAAIPATAPNISYTTPDTYDTGTAIANLTPTNSGGAVPANSYAQVTTFAGSSKGFNMPYGIAADPSGNVYVADAGNNVIRKITAAGAVSIFVPASAGLNNPQGVATDAAGNVYIGDSGNNLIRKVTPAGVMTTFAGSGNFGYTDGPSATASFKTPTGLATDNQGNVYVTDFGNNVIRKIDPSGTVSTFAGGSSNFNGPSGVAVDASGNVYVADQNNNQIKKVTPLGVVSIFAGSGAVGNNDGTGTNASFTSPYGVAVDAQGNVFVSDAGNSVIREISPAGNVVTFAGDGYYSLTNGIGTAAEFAYPTGITIDGQGNLFVSDLDNNAIREIRTTGFIITPALPAGLTFSTSTGVISGTPTAASPATVYTVGAYNTGGNSTFMVTITVVNALTDASLQNLTVSSGTLNPVFASAINNYAVSVPNTTSSISVTPTVDYKNATVTVNGTAVASGTPSGQIALNFGGNTITVKVTAADGVTTESYTIIVTRAALIVQAPQISYSSPKVYTVGVTIANLSPVNSGGAVPATVYSQVSTFAASSAGFNAPYGVAADANGNVYVADYGNNVIRKITPSGVVSIFAGGGTPGYADGTGAAASFNTPYGIATDAAGNVYVGDSGNNLIREISPAGVVTTLAGSGMVGYADGPGATANFNDPAGLTVDSQGNIYVADYGNNVVRKIDPSGLVSTLAGSGASGLVNATGAAAKFNGPFGLACDQAGNIYVADEGNNVIRKITPGGVVTTFAGSGMTGFADGAATSADFNSPYGVAVDAIGNVYVADAAISSIRKISPSGNVVTFAGDGNYNLLNGIGTAAEFNYPAGITIDNNGNLYVADNGNNTIREIRTTGYMISPALPAGLVFDAATGIISGTPTAASPLTVYTITAYNKGGNGSTTVSITVIMAASDATLQNLTASAGSLTPLFTNGTYAYTISVPNSTSSTMVTPTVNNANATVKVNGVSVTSGTASVPISLLAGTNVITVIVTAQDGVTKDTYTIKITRAAATLSSNNNLANLTISNGTLTPAFSAGTLSYTASVSNTTASIMVTPTVSDATATVTVNGTIVSSGSASPPISLAIGSNTITTVVTAQDGTTQTYTIIINRAASSNNNLTNLAISSGTLTPSFSPGTLSCTASVPNATTSITVTPTVSDATATVMVNGATVASGSASAPINLAVGPNTITTIVTAQDGTTQTYTITITRTASANNNLTNLAISSGTLTPTFLAGTLSYTASVSNATTSIMVTPTVSDATATVTVNATTVASGSASVPISLAVGPNTITTIVTAQDGTTQTYTITITRTASANNNLTNLAISSGTLTPTFSAGTLSYTASVPNATTSVTVTPTVSDGTATVTVNGTIVSSGSASPPISLAIGSNTITTVVTAQDGTTQTYTITINRAASSNDNLSNLSISSGTLTPLFSAGTLSYTASVSNATTSVTVTPTVSDATATVMVNGTTVASGSASAPINLAVGPNTITTIVTAQDGTTQTYTITITRAESANAGLVDLTVSAGTLAPNFSTTTLSYTDNVGNAINTITVTPTLSDTTATVAVNGVTTANGAASGSIALNIGSNVINIVVTAQNGSSQTYSVNVIRAMAGLSGNNNLTNLTISSGMLTPSFSPGTLSYTASVSNATTSVTVTPTVSDATATVMVNGTTVASGSASAPINLAVGPNTITTIVTAQDGTTQTYTITITRTASANNNLTNLAISSGTLTPTFSAGTLSYTASVSNATTNVTVTPTVSDATATVMVNGTTVASGSASAPIALAVGSNTITTVVTAQDGIAQTYTITINRAASSNDNLSNLTISSGTLTPAFSAGTLSYTASVSNATTSVTVTPTVSDATATVTVNGTTVASGSASAPISLAVGSNTITTIVTAQDGATQTFTITINRAASSNDNLSNLTISSGTLTPTFSPGTLSYTASVSNATTSITVTPTVSDATATIVVDGMPVTSGSASGPITLAVGANTVVIAVTAQDGAVQNYVVTVTRAGTVLSSNALLSSLSLSSGSVTPGFSPTVFSYSATVSNGTNSITVTPTVSDTTATVKVDGQMAISGTASGAINLLPGGNVILVMVTAQDGTTQTYTVVVNRALSSDADLSNLTLSQGTLSPVFSPSGLNYTAAVNTTVVSITVTPTADDPNATIMVNGVVVSSGNASLPISLSIGNNVITTIVTAADGVTTQTYMVTVNRAAALSSDATLSGLTINPGSISPAFDPQTQNYTASVGNGVSSVSITPATADPYATVTINGVPVLSGSPGSFLLSVGLNVFTVTVTAQDGSTLVYTITITRATGLIIVNNAFTPNGDGVNDTWTIQNINNYPDCTVKIFNRGGQIIYSSVGYGVAWDGTYNGRSLPTGTYYYIIDLNHNQGVTAGFVAIIR